MIRGSFSTSGSIINASWLTYSGLPAASPAAQDQDHFAAAAPGEPLPGLGLAFAGDLEAATRALEAPAKLQQVPADHPLRTTALFPGGFAGGTGGTVASSRAAISSLVSFSLGLDRPSSAFLLVMFPPCLSFPGLVRVTLYVSWGVYRCLQTACRFGQPPLRLCSRSRPQAVPHRLFVTSRRPAIFRPDAPASFMPLPIGNNPRCRRSERRRLLSWGIGQKKAVSFQERGFQQSASETALRVIWPRFPWASRRR